MDMQCCHSQSISLKETEVNIWLLVLENKKAVKGDGENGTFTNVVTTFGMNVCIFCLFKPGQF